MAVGAEAIFGESLITTKLDSAIAWGTKLDGTSKII
jgi:hypothetical protein